MGNKVSAHKDTNIFEEELKKLNSVVNQIIDEKDLFKNKDYNFLSQDVCSRYNIVLEEELKKHMKVDLKALGTSLYIIPKADQTPLTKHNLNKKQVCEMISNHYMKILYIICLIKYVYNLENNGDKSIAGIVFENIRITDDIFQIQYCAIPHKDYSKDGKDAYKIDFSHLDGISFFTKYFLSAEESNAFVSILRSVLGRAKKKQMREKLCRYFGSTKDPSLEEMRGLYTKKYKEKLSCQKGGSMTNLYLYIEKDNPVFSQGYCRAPDFKKFKTTTPEGKRIVSLYNAMKDNYKKNIAEIERTLSMIVETTRAGCFLKDITKEELDRIIQLVKTRVQVFYVQSIIDYQNLLDEVNKLPKHLFIM